MATCSCFILPHQVRPNKKYFPSYSDDTRKTETKDNYYAFLLLLRGYLYVISQVCTVLILAKLKRLEHKIG